MDRLSVLWQSRSAELRDAGICVRKERKQGTVTWRRKDEGAERQMEEQARAFPLSCEHLLSLLPWGPKRRKRDADGQWTVRRAQPSEFFWFLWRLRKDELTRLGVYCARPDEVNWYV